VKPVYIFTNIYRLSAKLNSSPEKNMTVNYIFILETQAFKTEGFFISEITNSWFLISKNADQACISPFSGYY
jgi:hypothetical protein